MQKSLGQWLDYIAGIHVSAIDMGLERVLPVAKRLGVLKADMDKPPTVFTVAGTNGKGSTTAVIAAICQANGLKTALYQSPHLVSFTERVRIDGVAAGDDDLIRAFEVVEAARIAEGLSLSFFEMTTLAAFWLFAKADCDVWVLEIGLGGRLDVVNIIDPDVAVITNIGIDHVDWLGDDIEKIGAEKAGIIRQGIPVILGAKSLPDSVHRIAKDLTDSIHQLGVAYEFIEQADSWVFSNAALSISLPKPQLSLMNAANAVAAVLASPLTLDLSAIAQAVSSVKLAGRFDRRVIDGRHWIFDVAHNVHGISFFITQWADAWQAHLDKYPNARQKVLFSMLGDKDVDAVLTQVHAAIQAGQIADGDWHIASIDNPRAMPLDELSGIVRRYIDAVHEYDSLSQATHGVIADSGDDDLIVVFGSFHTISESLITLFGKPY
ncbi:bifunctional folylpolyglutamate synthase/dihydrofolate synthase [Moraxella marmotae]|uniref:bifunctional folylpolyglutamate synthase/dihydrofolate synthase n=1 Tax=Moraxella marmotae TaxID=3344520 RepID=UPI0035F4F6D7